MTDAANAPATGDEQPPSTSDERLPDDHPAVVALAKANKEAEAARLKVKEMEDRDKSELQRAQDAVAEKEAALADLPKQIRTQVLRFASSATQKGFLDPEDALAFMDDDVDLADHKAVEAALDDLAQRKPHLVRTQKVPTRPKGPKGTDAGDPDDGLKGKERAAAALRQMKNR